MLREPELFSADELNSWSDKSEIIEGVWYPNRPKPVRKLSLWWRWRMASMVFLGIYDVVDWED